MLFASHLERGLSPPVHPFLLTLLKLYGRQLHHLTPDCVTHISCFVAFYEAFLGVYAHLAMWCSIFYLEGRIAGKGEAGRECGVVRVIPRRSVYPDLPLLGACGEWHRSYFYYPELSHSSGVQTFPLFSLGLPRSRIGWTRSIHDDPAEVHVLTERLEALVKRGLITHKYRGSCVAFSISKSVEPNEKLKVG